MKPVEIEILLKDGMSAGLEALQRKLDTLLAKSSNASDKAGVLRAALAGLNAQLEMLGKAGTPDLDQDGNIAAAEALRAKIAELEAQLRRLGETGETTPVVPPGLPQAARQFNGLHMSIQQMARELPSLAMGPQMFFLAISNNLPIFTDELARARKEYAELTKAGQKATPVWRQVLSSLFSWQTAMTTAIMLLVMYGKEITEWAGGLFRAEKQLDAAAEAQKRLNAARLEGARTAQEELLRLRLLLAAASDKARTDEERERAVDRLQKAYPGYLGNLSREKILAGETAGAYRTLATDILKAARAKASFDEAVKLAKEERTLNDAYLSLLDANREVWAGSGADSPEAMRKRLAELERQREEETIRANARPRSDGLYYVIPQSGEEKALRAILAAHDKWQAKNRELEAVVRGTDITDTTLPEDINKKAEEAVQAAEKEVAEEERLAEERKRRKEKNAEELLELERQNRRAEIGLMAEGKEKKLALINQEYQEEREAALRQAREWAESQNGTLTPEQASAATSALDNARRKREEETAAVYREELESGRQALRDYLAEYGTFQQRKLAIAEEYAGKIAKAQNDWERKGLESERDARLAAVETEALKVRVDWPTVFGEFGGMFSQILRPALDDARRYMETEEFRNADPSDQKALVEAVSRMEDALGGAGTLNFRRLGEETERLRSDLEALRESEAAERESLARLREAQAAHEAALESGTAAEVEASGVALEAARANAEASSAATRAAEETAEQSRRSVSRTAGRLRSTMDNVTAGLQKLSSGGLRNAYDGLVQLGKETGGVLGRLAEGFEGTPLIGGILSILDVLQDGLSDLIGGLIDGVMNAVGGILDDVLSGDLLRTTWESLGRGVSNILDALTFGGFSSWVGNGESDPGLKEDLERLAQSNADLEGALDRLAEKMDEGATSDARGIYERQKANLEAQERNTLEMMRRAGAAYSNGVLGIGGDKSSDHEINSAMGRGDWERISRIVGRTVGSASDFWTLTSEEMAAVADEATDLYTKIKTLASSGHEDAGQYMDDYIAYYRELEDLQDAYNEKVTGTPFDTLRDNFRQALLDMEGDTEDFAEVFGETMREAVLESMMTETYDARLREWYNDFAAAMEDGLLEDGELGSLREDWDDIVADAAAEWEGLRDALGEAGASPTTQEGKAGSFNAMSQEQGTKLEGLFTSGQMHWANMDETLEDVGEQMASAADSLRRIEENTGDSARHLDEIKNDIKKIIRDGLKMK